MHVVLIREWPRCSHCREDTCLSLIYWKKEIREAWKDSQVICNNLSPAAERKTSFRRQWKIDFMSRGSKDWSSCHHSKGLCGFVKIFKSGCRIQPLFYTYLILFLYLYWEITRLDSQCHIWFAETRSFLEWEAPHGHTSPSLAWYGWTHALEQKRPAPGPQGSPFLQEDVTSLLIDRANTCRDVRFDFIITQF